MDMLPEFFSEFVGVGVGVCMWRLLPALSSAGIIGMGCLTQLSGWSLGSISGPQAFMASTFPAEQSPQPCVLL